MFIKILQNNTNKLLLFVLVAVFISSNFLFINNYKRIAVNQLNYYYITHAVGFYDYMKFDAPYNINDFNTNEIIAGTFFYLFGKNSLSLIILSLALGIFFIICFSRFALFLSENRRVVLFALMILLADPVFVSSLRRYCPHFLAGGFLFMFFPYILQKKHKGFVKILLMCSVACLIHYSSIIFIGILMISSSNKNIRKIALIMGGVGVVYLFLSGSFFARAVEINIKMFQELFSLTFNDIKSELQCSKIITSWIHQFLFIFYLIFRIFTFSKIKTKITNNNPFVLLIFLSIIMLCVGITIDSLILPYSLIVLDISIIIDKYLPKSMLAVLLLLFTLNFFPEFIYKKHIDVMRENRINNLINVNESFYTEELMTFFAKNSDKTIGFLDAPYYKYSPYVLTPLDIGLLSDTAIKTKNIHSGIDMEEIGGVELIMIVSLPFESGIVSDETYLNIKESYKPLKTIHISKKQSITFLERI